jgi:hypothetical protein
VVHIIVSLRKLAGMMDELRDEGASLPELREMRNIIDELRDSAPPPERSDRRLLRKDEDRIAQAVATPDAPPWDLSAAEFIEAEIRLAVREMN